MPYSPRQTEFAQGEHVGRALDRWWFLCIYGFYIYIVGLFFFVLLMVKWFSIFFFFFQVIVSIICDHWTQYTFRMIY